MSNYTPSTKQVREAYEVAHEEVGVPCDLAGFDRWLAIVKADAWDEGNLAAYPLQLAVGQFIDNGGDAWGNLDDAYEQVSAAPNPYREQETP